MDLNDIKNRAKDLLADLTDNRPDREEQPGPGRADDAVDDSAVRTDRLEPPLQRPATDPHDPHPRDADLRDPDRRESDLRDPDLRDPNLRDPDLRDPDLRDPDLRDPDLRDPNMRDPDLRDPVPPREDPAPADQLDGPGRHHLRDTSAQPATPSTPDALDADGLPVDPDRLVTAERAQSYSARWDEVKGEFVDEPRRAVVKADALVGELLDELGQLFTQQRRGIEQDLDNDEVSTEDLRVALRRYRSFFDRLLSV